MMKSACRYALLWLCLASLSLTAQMTTDQKLLDFQQLAALYAKQYAPYEWKRDALQFDLLQLGPWLERIAKSASDIEFLEICAEYVSSLKDGHSQFFVPSNYTADSGLFVDSYDGRVFIDLIDRRLLPQSLYPFETGDELLGMDGRTPAEWANELSRFTPAGNRRAAMRNALDLMVFRPQSTYPSAHLTPDRSRITVRRQNGLVEAFDIPWAKNGVPLTVIGPVPSPFLREQAGAGGEHFMEAHRVFRGLPELRKARIPLLRAVKGIGSIQPPYAAPVGFQQRLGRTTRDLLYSGTFQASGLRVGLIRLGSFADPSNPFLASQIISQFSSEITFMERNTDGLIIDVMRNPGGDFCMAQDLASILMPRSFLMPGAEIRATREWISRFEGLIEELTIFGAEKWVTDLLKAMLGDIRGAYSENRGRTGPLPLCDLGLEVEPFRDSRGNRITYSKPLMLLVDDFTASAAEIFASSVQDNQRGIVFGMPTMGAGGTVSFSPLPTGWYSETSATVTQSLLVRSKNVVTREFPVSPYIENIGIRPDVAGDLMTVENLRGEGRAFVRAFTEAMVSHIQKN